MSAGGLGVSYVSLQNCASGRSGLAALIVLSSDHIILMFSKPQQ